MVLPVLCQVERIHYFCVSSVVTTRNGFALKSISVIKYICLSIRCIELFPSTYDEAKRRIMGDARINAKQFVGDDDIDEETKVETNNHVDKRHSRSRSRQRSRSTSRGSRIIEVNLFVFETLSFLDYRQRDAKRRHSPSASPPSRSRRKFN